MLVPGSFHNSVWMLRGLRVPALAGVYSGARMKSDAKCHSGSTGLFRELDTRCGQDLSGYPLPAGWDHWMVCQEGLRPKQLLTTLGGFGPVGFDGSSAVKGHLPNVLCLETGKSRLGPLQLSSCHALPGGFPTLLPLSPGTSSVYTTENG